MAILIDLKVEKAPRGDGGEAPRPRPQPTDPSEVFELSQILPNLIQLLESSLGLS
jgi:hypothetical protein